MKFSTESEKKYAMSIKKNRFVKDYQPKLYQRQCFMLRVFTLLANLYHFSQNLLNIHMLLKHRANFKYVWARDSKIYVKNWKKTKLP